MIPPYSRVKIHGKNLAGNTDWVGQKGIVVPEYNSTLRVHFYGVDDNGKPLLRGVSSFHEKSLKVEPPEPGDVVLIPAFFMERVQTGPDCKVMLIDKKTPFTLPLSAVVAVDPKGMS